MVALSRHQALPRVRVRLVFYSKVESTYEAPPVPPVPRPSVEPPGEANALAWALRSSSLEALLLRTSLRMFRKRLLPLNDFGVGGSWLVTPIAASQDGGLVSR